MLPYILVFLFSSICTFVAYKNQRVNLIFIPLVVLAVLVPAMLSGYRDLTVGIDVLMYGLPTFDNVYWIDGLRTFGRRKHLRNWRSVMCSSTGWCGAQQTNSAGSCSGSNCSHLHLFRLHAGACGIN